MYTYHNRNFICVLQEQIQYYKIEHKQNKAAVSKPKIKNSAKNLLKDLTGFTFICNNTFGKSTCNTKIDIN